MMVVGVEAKDVTLEWEPSPTPGVTGYKIYKAVDKEITNVIDFVIVDNVLTYQFTDLDDYTGYWFVVTALKDEDESDFSNAVFSPPKLQLDIQWEIIP